VIPGVSGALNPGSIATAAVRIYDLGFLISTSVAGALYWGLCALWPVRIFPVGKEALGEGMGFEGMKRTEGFFGGEEVVPGYLVETLDGVEGCVEIVKGAEGKDA
jgi:NCS1 family nucleobase:cation symporter-1